MKTRRVSCGARRGNRVWKDEKVGAEKRQEGWREGGEKEQVSYEPADLPSSLSEKTTQPSPSPPHAACPSVPPLMSEQTNSKNKEMQLHGGRCVC